MIAAVFVGVILLAIGFAAWISRDECPRMIRGYNCRANCDHSFDAVQEAKRDMGVF